MGSLNTLPLAIAVCAGIVAATLAPSARKTIPRWFELGLWIALIFLCWFGVRTLQDPRANELTGSLAWAAAQIVNTAVGLLGAGFAGWVSAHRFAIADWVVILFGVDVLVLALVSSRRDALGWQPRVKLRDWMELPPAVAPKPVVVVEDPFAALNRRCAAAIAVGAAAALTWAVNFAIWMRDFFVPREAHRLARGAASGREQSMAWLESLVIKVMELKAFAHKWYATACDPALRDLAAKAATIARDRRRGVRTSHVLDLRPLLSARSIALYGKLPPSHPEDGGPVEDGSEHSDRLAS